MLQQVQPELLVAIATVISTSRRQRGANRSDCPRTQLVRHSAASSARREFAAAPTGPRVNTTPARDLHFIAIHSLSPVLSHSCRTSPHDRDRRHYVSAGVRESTISPRSNSPWQRDRATGFLRAHFHTTQHVRALRQSRARRSRGQSGRRQPSGAPAIRCRQKIEHPENARGLELQRQRDAAHHEQPREQEYCEQDGPSGEQSGFTRCRNTATSTCQVQRCRHG